MNETVIRIPRNFKWDTPRLRWIVKRIWIPEKLQYIIKRTAKIQLNREEMNRKFNKILLQEFTIDASLETDIQKVDQGMKNDLIGRDSMIFLYALLYNPYVKSHKISLRHR